MQLKLFILFSVLMLSTSTFAQDNPDLAFLFEADQAMRQVEDKDWAKIRTEDEKRRTAVISILRDGGVKTAKDYYHAAIIFQHGDTKEEIRLAHAFATISSAMDGGSSASNWIKAASWDRLLRKFEQPQWYGTQYVKSDSGEWTLYFIEPEVVTDEDRAALSVPSLEKAKERLTNLNAKK